MTQQQRLHKLLHQWTYWFDLNDYQPFSGVSNGSIREIYQFDTVEHFWELHREIPSVNELGKGISMYLLHSGINPNNDLQSYVKWKFVIDYKYADQVIKNCVCFYYLI